MLRKAVYTLATLSLFTACTADPDPAQTKSRSQAACLDSLAANNGRLAENECRTACELDPADSTSCAGIALAGLQSSVEEISTWVSFLQPAQSPAEFVANAQREYNARYDTLVDARPLINQFLGGLIGSLRSIREGVLLSVGSGGKVEVAIEELPLDPRLLSIIYGRADSFSVKGHWTEKELAGLGAAANGLLMVIDIILAHDLKVDGVGADTFSGFNGLPEIIEILGEILNSNPDLLTVDAPDTLTDARNELHSALSLLAGREDDKEEVSLATPGLLGLIEAEFEADKHKAGKRPEDPRVLKLLDVDGDKTLSRGDNFVLVAGINGEDVTFALIYPISATLTQTIFTFIREGNENLDGNKLPAKIAPVYNSIIKELGIFSTILESAGINTDTMPDIVGLDYNAFFEGFTGVRNLLPHWYEDESTTGVNAHYFDGATVSSVKLFLAYEEEKADGDDNTDAGHFAWASSTTEVTWNNNRKPTALNLVHPEDGLQPDTGFYFLWQDPAFAGLLQVNTTPLLNYGMTETLSTHDEFVTPKQSWMTNAVINGLITWWTY